VVDELPFSNLWGHSCSDDAFQASGTFGLAFAVAISFHEACSQRSGGGRVSAARIKLGVVEPDGFIGN